MLTSLFPWILYVLAWITTLYGVHNGEMFWQAFLISIVFFNGGIQGLWAAVGHLIFPTQTAKKIGWDSNGFQTEIGGTNLAVGITGVLTICFHSWAVPIGLVIAIFYIVCAYIHIKERMQSHNDAPCNSGPMLYSTIVVIISIFLSLLFRVLY